MKTKPQVIMQSPFHTDIKQLRCCVCHFKFELFYSWSDFDVETKHVVQREIECPMCHGGVFAQAYFSTKEQ